jgi:hypothetical protein
MVLMTWIVGASTPFGFAYLVSDTRVRWGNGIEKDCLLKVFPLGQFLAGGFAGSVESGFAILSRLTLEFQQAPPTTAWDLDAIAATWLPRVMRHVWKRQSDANRRLGSEIIIAAAHPTRDLGIAGVNATAVYAFRSPKFVPQKATARGHGHAAIGIGSGEHVRKYTDMMSAYTASTEFQLSFEQGARAQAMNLATTFATAVARSPVPGISEAVHIARITRGQVAVEGVRQQVLGPGGSVVKEVSPSTEYAARSYAEFFQRHGPASAAA